MFGLLRSASALILMCTAASAATLSIENAKLVLRYDEASAIATLTQKASGEMFLRAGNFETAPGAARTEAITDPVFGDGQRVQAPRQGGGTVQFDLYATLPFLLVRGDVRHESATAEDIKTIPVGWFDLDLGKPVAALRTMGTAGLSAPDAHPGSYLFLTLADPGTRRGVVCGWLTAARGDGVIFSKITDGQVRFETRLDYGRLRLRAGDTAKVETLVVGLFEDARLGQEQFADAIARQLGIHLHPQTAGYCTWYSNPHGGAADEKAIIELAQVVAKELKPFGMTVVQIDDKWQDGQERNGPARRFTRVKPDGPYPHGMQPVAERLKDLGLTAGIWFLPFASDYLDPEFKDHQDWFARRPDGKPYETAWGNTSLDLTRPDVQQYLTGMIRTIHGWGFNYFKMDGLWTGTASQQIYVNDGYRDDQLGANAPFYDPFITNLEALRDGLKLLRRAAGPDVFFSGCNVSQNMRTLGGCMGLVDSMRIGPDNGHRWASYKEEIAQNGSGSIITGPIRGSRLYFLNGRTWWNDPDPTYVRAAIPIEHARLITSWVALSGQFYLNSDWIPELPPERLDIIKRTIPAHHATARPVDYFDSALPRLWIVTDTHGSVRRDVLGLYNWENDEQNISCSPAGAGLDPSKTYFGFDFWFNTPIPALSGEMAFSVPRQSCRVIALRAAEGHPVLVSTSRHVTQGVVDVSEEQWRDDSLSGVSDVLAGDPYELRIAGLTDGAHQWKLASAKVSGLPADSQATIESLAPRESEPGWARAVIRSKRSQKVEWTLRFEGAK